MHGDGRVVDGSTDEVGLPHGGSVGGTGPAGIEIRGWHRCGDDARMEGPLRCGAIEAEGGTLEVNGPATVAGTGEVGRRVSLRVRGDPRNELGCGIHDPDERGQ